MTARLAALLSVVGVVALAAPVAAQGGRGAGSTVTEGVEAGGLRVGTTRPILLPVVRDRVLIYAYPGDGGRRDLSRAMLPGGRVGTRNWAGMQEGDAIYDPANGYFYNPGVFGRMMPVSVKLDDGSVSTVYMPYDPSRPLSSAQYADLLRVAREFAEQQAALEREGGRAVQQVRETVQEPAERVGSRPADQGRRFGSTLAPTLGGDSRVSMEFALGEAMLRQGREGEAIGAFHRSSAAAPGDAASHLALALAFTGVGSYDLAAEAVRRGLRLVPDPGALTMDGAKALGSAEALGGLRSAVGDALAESPEDADLNVVAGFLAFLAGDYAMAAGFLEESRETGTRDVGVARLLVAARAEVRRQEAAAAESEIDPGAAQPAEAPAAAPEEEA